MANFEGTKRGVQIKRNEAYVCVHGVMSHAMVSFLKLADPNIYMCIYIYIYMHKQVYMYVCVYDCMCVYVCMYIYIYIFALLSITAFTSFAGRRIRAKTAQRTLKILARELP